MAQATLEESSAGVLDVEFCSTLESTPRSPTSSTGLRRTHPLHRPLLPKRRPPPLHQPPLHQPPLCHQPLCHQPLCHQPLCHQPLCHPPPCHQPLCRQPR